MLSALLHTAIVLHRWAGAVLGLLMLGWCLSGVVMMYVPYPALDEATRLAALAPLSPRGCCRLPAILDRQPLDGLQVEMLGTDPVLRVRVAGERRERLFDLASGLAIESVSAVQARTVAQLFGGSRGYAGPARATGSVGVDQWTVEAGFRAAAPLLTFTWDDPRRPVLYVSGSSGRAVQYTEASQRFWNYLGSVPHWIYFLPLRKNPQVWSRVVIWSSVTGSLLTLIGLCIGIAQLGRMRGRARLSPYGGLKLWHHLPGVLFGVLVLTWVASGLFSMNPWGFLEDDTALAEPARLAGMPAGAGGLRASLGSLLSSAASGKVSLHSAPLDGRLYFVATDGESRRTRYDARGAPAPLRVSDLAFIGSTLAHGMPVDAPTLLRQSDAYYFPHHRIQPVFPVYRFARHDAERTRYYIDALSGSLVRRVGSAERGYRWLHEGLHRLDFLETRPWWDVVMLLLMSGVTWVCATGLILAFRHWRRLLTRA